MSDEAEGDADQSDDSGEGLDERDPFGRLEESAGDRDGDPFETLSAPDEDEGVGPIVDGDVDPAPDEGVGPAADEGVGPAADEGADPAASSQTATGADASTEDAGSDAATKEPEPDAKSTDDGIQEVSEPQVRPGAPSVDGVASDAEEGAVDRGDPFGDESAFQEMDVGAIDEDEVWRDIADAQARGSVRDASKRDYAEVDKHRYCERCEHFTDPPEVGCTHEGTEILEFVDNDTVRLADCPIVAERRALQRGDKAE